MEEQAAPIRRVAVYPGGPELHVPPTWTDAQVEAALAKLRAAQEGVKPANG